MVGPGRDLLSIMMRKRYSLIFEKGKNVETALYFPYMRVPETSWFTQVLLYWDGAAAIVPVSMNDREAQLGEYMKELVAARLAYLIPPNRGFRNDTSEFDSRFLNMLGSLEIPDARRNYTQARIDNWRWTRLHSEEATPGLFSELHYRGLANHQGYNQDHTAEWWAVEPEVASLYMAYLVGSICRADDRLFPVTDSRSSLSNLITPNKDTVTSRFRALRYTTITQALPVPSRLIPVAELASFKERYGDQLHRLQRHLNGQIVDLAVIEDDSLRSAKAESVIQEIQDDVAVLTEHMLKRRWPKVVLAGVGGLVASALAAGTAIASGGGALAVGLGIASGLASMGPAGYQAVDLISSPGWDQRSPLAYAALAQTL